MKSRHFLGAAAVLWAVIVLGASLLPGTAARYRAQVPGSVTAGVAAWKPNVTADGWTESQTVFVLRHAQGGTNVALPGKVSVVLDNSGNNVSAKYKYGFHRDTYGSGSFVFPVVAGSPTNSYILMVDGGGYSHSGDPLVPKYPESPTNLFDVKPGQVMNLDNSRPLGDKTISFNAQYLKLDGDGQFTGDLNYYEVISIAYIAEQID